MTDGRRDVELLGGMVARGVTAEEAAKLLSRKAFVEKYCKERGWTIETMTVSQLMELREQEGWKNSGNSF